MRPPSLLASDFTYHLPEEKIALYPEREREQAKLLFYRNGVIQHKQFIQLPELLPKNAILYFNDTRVIHARFRFSKPTGAVIEIVLLAPVLPSMLMATALTAVKTTSWICAIGNLKRWKEGSLRIEGDGCTVEAKLNDRDKGLVEFSWTPPDLPFAEVINAIGSIPLPPYIRRKEEVDDDKRYQTIYSQTEGAVAAPTAGLHFTDAVLEKIQSKKILTDYLTLHVSAGTFIPMNSTIVQDHKMHDEQIVVKRSNLLNLLTPEKTIIAVGTTSLRTLESIYWFGAGLLTGQKPEFIVTQETPYQFDRLPALNESIKAVISLLDSLETDEISGKTSLFIYPGYQFQVCHGLITNFHQPGSTLLLLVAAFVGKDWKEIYAEALSRNYRFLSYGDASLLIAR